MRQTMRYRMGLELLSTNFKKKPLFSNVHLRYMPLAGYLYKVTMQKVPQILRQKQGKSK